MHPSFSPDGGPIGLRLALQAMGTRFELVLADERCEHELRPIGEMALACVQDWHDRLSAFDPGSLVGRINAEGFDRPVRVDQDMIELLRACERYHALSGGAFDVAMGSVMRRHGFRGDADPGGSPAFGMRHVEIDEKAMTVRLDAPGVAMDFGAIAKGWAIDRALRVLRELGVRSALLHGGTSTVGVLGGLPGGGPWRVRIEADLAAPVALLRDASLSVSAPRGRLNELGQGHIIDPRTGNPSVGARLAAAIGVYSADTDALSTALVVLGERPGSIPPEVVSILPRGEGAWLVEGEARGRVEFGGHAQGEQA